MTNEGALGDLSEIVGGQVRLIRERRGWSVEKLADACTAAGAPQLTVNSIYALESGRKERATGRRRRHITIDEFLVLAYALDVNPVDLVVPGELLNAAPFDIAPGVSTTAGKARDWISGLGFLEEPESRADLLEAIRWMPANRADRLLDSWTPPPHVIAREAVRGRQFNAAFPPDLDDTQPEGKESDA